MFSSGIFSSKLITPSYFLTNKLLAKKYKINCIEVSDFYLSCSNSNFVLIPSYNLLLSGDPYPDFPMFEKGEISRIEAPKEENL